MNNNAKAWVAALRSGEYKQGRGYLRVNDNFCCLGVACEIALKNGLNLDVQLNVNQHGVYTYSGASTLLPDPVRKWLNMRNCHGDTNTHSLTHMNDNGVSFEVISSFIETHPDLFYEDEDGE